MKGADKDKAAEKASEGTKKRMQGVVAGSSLTFVDTKGHRGTPARNSTNLGHTTVRPFRVYGSPRPLTNQSFANPYGAATSRPPSPMSNPGSAWSPNSASLRFAAGPPQPPTPPMSAHALAFQHMLFSTTVPSPRATSQPPAMLLPPQRPPQFASVASPRPLLQLQFSTHPRVYTHVVAPPRPPVIEN
jgi:hypothetical protein